MSESPNNNADIVERYYLDVPNMHMHIYYLQLQKHVHKLNFFFGGIYKIFFLNSNIAACNFTIVK